ncbi:MAG: hypothetical protein ABI867_30130 [Kofleriaceae bacterium]
MKPQRVALSRAATTVAHDGGGTLDEMDVEGDLIFEPEIGKPLQVFLDNGRMVRTTAIERIVQAGERWMVATRNSLYQLVFQHELAVA